MSEREQALDRVVEMLLAALPDSTNAGPDGTGYKYAWNELDSDEQDWVKQVRADVRAALDAARAVE